MVDDQLEESVHQQDTVGQDAAAVQENRLWREKKKTLKINKCTQYSHCEKCQAGRTELKLMYKV